MTVFTLQYILKGLKGRQTRPVDFAAAVLRLSAREQQAKKPKSEESVEDRKPEKAAV